MTYKDPEVNRAWHRARKAEIRAELSARPLHVKLGVDTYEHRQAVLDDPRMGRRWDQFARVWNHNHLYRETITLARTA